MSPARHLLLLVCLLGPCGVLADRAPESGHAAYQAALKAFEAGDYADAVDVLERLLDTDGSCAPCAHLLGKSYGRMAERAGWLEALRLARKTQSALEHAVELAPEDPAALTDLIKYYRAAPMRSSDGWKRCRRPGRADERPACALMCSPSAGSCSATCS
jgi:tetratricopeptide (TPR) repeat protein